MTLLGSKYKEHNIAFIIDNVDITVLM